MNRFNPIIRHKSPRQKPQALIKFRYCLHGLILRRFKRDNVIRPQRTTKSLWYHNCMTAVAAFGSHSIAIRNDFRATGFTDKCLHGCHFFGTPFFRISFVPLYIFIICCLGRHQLFSPIQLLYCCCFEFRITMLTFYFLRTRLKFQRGTAVRAFICH